MTGVRNNLCLRLFLGQPGCPQLDDLLSGDLADGGLVDQRSINASGKKLLGSIDSAVVDQDSVAFGATRLVAGD